MTLPPWAESVGGLIGQLLAKPIRVSKRMQTTAAYLGVSFARAVAEVCDLGIAKPLSELQESKLQKIRSTDIADAAGAHNTSVVNRAKGEAEAELTLAKAEKKRAEARAIDGEAELRRMEEQRKLAEAKAAEARARLEAAATQLRLQGGELYLEPPASSGADPDSA